VFDLIITKQVKTTWSANNKDHYESLGYQFSGFRKPLFAKIEDLMSSSNVKVEIQCDYCNISVIRRSLSRHNELVKGSYVKKDCCKNCSSLKILDEVNYKQENGILLPTDKSYFLFRNNRLKALRLFIEKHGDLNNMLDSKEGRNLYEKFTRYNESIEEAVIQLGFDLDTVKKNKSYDFYSDINNITPKIDSFIKAQNRFPTKEEIVHILGIGQCYIDKQGGMYELKRLMQYIDKDDLVDENGFINRSSYEYIVAQYFIHNNITYKREQSPFSKLEGNFRSDFTVYPILSESPVHVEVWGFNEGGYAERYKKRKQHKKKLYENYNRKLH
jgi:hypothetical protein